MTRRRVGTVRKAGNVTGRVVGGCCDSISVEARQANRAPAGTGFSFPHLVPRFSNLLLRIPSDPLVHERASPSFYLCSMQ